MTCIRRFSLHGLDEMTIDVQGMRGRARGPVQSQARALRRVSCLLGFLGSSMSFSLFLRGFLVAIAIFAVVTYFLTQSIWTTVINTIICAALIQIGYVIGILWMVARTKARPADDAHEERADTSGLDPAASKKPGRIGNIPGSRHP